jgi:hypothetical protein
MPRQAGHDFRLGTDARFWQRRRDFSPLSECRTMKCDRPFRARVCWIILLLVVLGADAGDAASVVINEVHYHPVEKAAFDTNGLPLLDLSEDVHEFIELFNPNATNIAIAGWKLSGAVSFEFAAGTFLPAGGFAVVARNPARLTAVGAYGLTNGQVFGPWEGRLGNSGDTVRLKNDGGDVIDTVSYSAASPWAIGADALGADDEWTGLNSSNYQYRGRSLERVSASWSGNDPANWLASPLAGNPSPGRSNAVSLVTPRPVVTAFAVYQAGDGESIINAGQAVRVDAAFSGTNTLNNVAVEYFVDDVNVTGEITTTTAMSAAGPAAFTVTLPGQAARSIVRFRFRADRGAGMETVSPRADDPFAWHAWFVTPARSSTNRIYDCFISTASLAVLTNNISQLPRRTTVPDPPGWPRASWNADEPATLIYNGTVHDIRLRYHGSPFRRSTTRNSWKAAFPRYRPMEGLESVFVTDKTDVYAVANKLYGLAGLPYSSVRWVDWYLNNNALLVRLEQREMDGLFFEDFARAWHAANPGQPREETGEWYKAQGTMLGGDPEGPFGAGTFYQLPPRLPYWQEWQRYDWTYAIQMHKWKGHAGVMDLCRGMWTARASTNSPNLTALRAFLEANFDVDATLNYLALRQWSCGWDDIFQNYFLWRRAGGRYAMLPWDVDSEIGGRAATTSIFIGELNDPANFWQGPNWLKDSWFKAYRNEFKERLFLLNNTLLNPTNISALGFANYRTWADQRFASVNSQLALGVFHRPNQPVALSPSGGQAVLPGAALQSSAYAHSTAPAPAHASTTWFIRHADSTWSAPVFKLTSTSNLTSLAIPFGELQFGDTYFWKCLFTDASGHPSLESAEVSFVFGAQTVTVPLVAIDAATPWRYEQSGVAPATNWNRPGFDDSAWPQGPALLGASPGGLPDTLRTTLTPAVNKMAFYFRTTFNFTGDVATARLRLRQIIDDGAILYLNGVEILRTGMNSGDVSSITPAFRNVGTAVFEGPFNIPSDSLVQGTNVLAAEVHQFNNSSTDVAFGVALDALVPPSPGGVVLSEILADNRATITNGGTLPDFIELFNSTAITQNLNGLSLSDNVLVPGKYIFPAGAGIPPGGRLVVWCDDQTNAPGLHTGFALDNDGQTVALFSVTTNGFTLADSVMFGLQLPDYSIARVGGTWQLALPTPGEANAASSTGSPAALKINEWMATDSTGGDWIELFNTTPLPVPLGDLYLTDDFAAPAKGPLMPLSFIGPLGHRRFIADENPGQGARHVDFKLSGTGEVIGLYDAALALIDGVTFGPQTSDVSQGRLPDGTANIVFFPLTPSPEDANFLPLTNLVISEVLAHSDAPLEDLVEIQNLSASPVDVGGWWLSDQKANLRKFRIPTNTVIAAGGFAVFAEHQFNTNTGVPFSLNGARGDRVFLAAADAAGNLTGHRADAAFGPAENGVPHGRFATSQGFEFAALITATFGFSNSAPRVGPVVISEIMYHPPDLFDGSDNGRDEFIELRNIAATNVALFDPARPANCWRLRDAVDFTFPTNTTLAPGEAVLVLSFDPVTNAPALAAFLDAYGSISNARMFGPFTGQLDNSSDSVELVKPDAPVDVPGPDFGFVPSVLVDKARYRDALPWPVAADGSGASLQRRVNGAYGNDPTNWLAAAPSPGAMTTTNLLPVVAVSTPATVLIGPADVPLTAVASDADGSVIRVEFFANGVKLGEDATAPYAFIWTNAPLGNHALTARARDNHGAAGVSAPVALSVVSQLTTVALTAPVNGSLFQAGGIVSMTATATNAATAITNVEFLVNGVRIASDTGAPFNGSWAAAAGSFTLAAVAADGTGLRTTSAPVQINVQAVLTTNITLIASNSIWRYLDNGTDQGTNWQALDFSDLAWSNGLAELGYGDTIAPDNKPETTVIGWGPDPNNRHITYYFRQKFVVDSLANVSNVTLGVLRDDGALAHLNAVEVFRSNMPTGAVNYLTRAPASCAGADEATFFPTSVSPSRLVVGTNILAVEVHSVTNTSVDMSFAAMLTMTRTALGPAILAPPQGRTVFAGATVAFTADVAGTAPLIHQWRFNGVPIPGATAATLVLGNVNATNAGSYSVTVSNSVAAVTSAGANLVVISPPQLVPVWNPASGRLMIHFNGDATRSSIIYASTNLQIWQPAATSAPGAGVISWEDAASSNHPARFYKVGQQ